MESVIPAYLFVLGAALGSFALVLADRMHAGKDWVRGRSVCDHCGHKLGPIDLIPLLSWVMQNGRCRYCQKKVSVVYPLVELGLGGAFLVSYTLAPYELKGLFIGLFALWLLGLVLATALVVADLKWFLLPSKIVYPMAAIALVHRFIAFFAFEQNFVGAVVNTALALLISSGLFWVLHRVSNGKWIGDGDYRLGLAIAFYLGDPIKAWMALFFASVVGLILSVPVIVRSKNKMKLKIPFGPFLIIGLFMTYLVGQRVADWYSSLFNF